MLKPLPRLKKSIFNNNSEVNSDSLVIELIKNIFESGTITVLDIRTLLEPLDYECMVHLISNSRGIITDSGGLQEEAVCANKRVLVCRDTTERPETIDCGLGKLIDTHIRENIWFLDEEFFDVVENPYGNNVCEKIVSYI